MRKIGIVILGLLFAFAAEAQYVDYVYQVSQQYNNGTARFTSMGGAFGALGGDLTTLSYNPAGLGIYRRTDFGLTTKYFKGSTDASFLGKTSTDNATKFNVNNFGIAIPIKLANKDKGIISYNIGLSFNRTNDFDNNFSFRGNNAKSSILDVFLSGIDGTHPEQLNGFGSQLAFNTFLIDTIPGTNNLYGMINSLNGKDKLQGRDVEVTGYNREWAISQAVNISNKVFIGATLGITSFERVSTFTHNEATINNTSDKLVGFDYNYRTKTWGTGYNLKVGVIAQPLDFLRLGAAVHTPTVYKVNEEYSAGINAHFTDGVESWSSPNGSYEFRAVTPLRAMFSTALIFKTYGLLSIDYELVDYSMMKLKTDNSFSNDSFSNDNRQIRDTYKSVGNIKIGGELNFGQLALRGGYAFYPSPVKDGFINSGSDRKIFSGGFGYREAAYYIDFAYAYTAYDTEYVMYGTDTWSAPITKLSNNNHQFMMTFGLRF
jgi:hypothetical protein